MRGNLRQQFKNLWLRFTDKIDAPLFALAIALQVEKNAALASAIYFAVNQLLLFVHSTVTKNDTNTMRKTIGASLALLGLVYIAMR